MSLCRAPIGTLHCARDAGHTGLHLCLPQVRTLLGAEVSAEIWWSDAYTELRANIVETAVEEADA